MTKRTYRLREIAPPVSAAVKPVGEQVWLLNLDQIEPHSGTLLSKEYVQRSRLGTSTQPFDSGNVLYSKLRPYLNKVLLPDSTGYCTSELVPLRPNQELVTREYLAAYLRSGSFLNWVSQQVDGAKMPRVSMKVLWEHSIEIPTLDEQRRITSIFDKVDKLRRKRREAICLADEFLRAVFIDMFGTLDSQTNAQVSFGDIADLDAPMVDPTSDEYADMLHVGPDRIEKGNGQLLECETARAEGLISKKFIFDERYVLYSKIRPALKKCALAEFRGLCSADMYPVRPVEGQVTREFIWGLLLSDAFDRYIVTLPDRANIPKLNRTELNAFQFRLPPIKLQHNYSALVRTTMKLKRRHQNFLAEADSLPASFQFFI